MSRTGLAFKGTFPRFYAYSRLLIKPQLELSLFIRCSVIGKDQREFVFPLFLFPPPRYLPSKSKRMLIPGSEPVVGGGGGGGGGAHLELTDAVIRLQPSYPRCASELENFPELELELYCFHHLIHCYIFILIVAI